MAKLSHRQSIAFIPVGLPSSKSKARRRTASDRSLAAARSDSESPLSTHTYDLIAFDGDDTLWDTQPLYETAKDEFEDLCKDLGLWDRNVRNQLDYVDAERVALHGFSRSRFPGSLVNVLKARAESMGVDLPPGAIRRARNLGKRVFEKSAPLRNIVPSLIASLGLRYRLILVTQGDRRIQVQRIRAHDLDGYFESVHVVARKSPATLRRIFRSKGVDLSRVLVVGDSLRSDIHPALAIGASALWIPSKSWRFEHAALPKSDRFFKARSLGDLRKLL